MDQATTDEAPAGDKKRRRVSGDKSKHKSAPTKHKTEVDTAAATSPAKSPSEQSSKNNLGSIIGRKRKERKAKRG